MEGAKAVGAGGLVAEGAVGGTGLSRPVSINWDSMQRLEAIFRGARDDGRK